MRYSRKNPKFTRITVFLGFLILSTLAFSAFLPIGVATAVTIPFSSTPVSDSDLDGFPGTGAWGDASSYTIPLENGQPAPYGTATLYVKHNGANIYYRIDGSIDVAWVSAAGNHFWLGMQISPTGTSHHGASGTWDGVYFGLWDGTDYAPTPTYPPTPVDTNGFSKPPPKDVTQNAVGAMRYSGSASPYSFTAEWKRALNTGDASDIAFVADGVTTYNFFVSTDSNGRGSSGGGIDHSVVTNLNTLKLAAPPPTVHDVAIINVVPSATLAHKGYSRNVSVEVRNEGTASETFSVTAYYGPNSIGTQPLTLAASATTTLVFTWDTTNDAYGSYTISANASSVPGETDLADNSRTDGSVTVTIPGDINGDHNVKVLDLFSLGKAYGSVPGNSNWNPNADINNNANVNNVDMGIFSANFGQSW